MPMEDERDYISRTELKAILADYVPRRDLEAIFAHEWERLKRRLRSVIADAMTACARAWLPDNPAHIQEASAMLSGLSADEDDAYVRAVENGIVAKLRENAPVH